MTDTPFICRGVALRDDTKQVLDTYAERGIYPGGFLFAVLANDLMMAVGRASDDSLKELPVILSYIYCKLPLSCHGTPQKVDNWIAERSKQK